MYLREAEVIKKRWQEYTEELYKKDLHDPDNHDGVTTHLESEEGDVKWALGSITMNKVSESEVAQLGLILCNSMDCRPPGSSIPGILQARILKWVAISFSRNVPLVSLIFLKRSLVFPILLFSSISLH